MTGRGNVRIDAGRRGKRTGQPHACAVLLATLLAAIALGPTPLRGQATGEEEEAAREGGFELTGQVGLITPVSNLTEDVNAFDTSLKVGLAYSLDGTYWTSRKFGLGFAGLYSPAELQTVASGFQGAVPNDLGNADYFAGIVNAVYRFRGTGSGAGAEPYIAAGGGVRRLSVDAIASPQVESSTDPVGTLAGGIRVEDIGFGLLMKVEIRDFISSFESPATGSSKLQHDFAITFGLGTRIR